MSEAPNFNRLARLYLWMELCSFGPWLWLTRITFLARLKGCRRALVLGDGDGRFTARLLRENQAVRVDAVDGSQGMLAALRRRAGKHAQRVRTELGDIREWAPACGLEQYDLVATHFFLDCLTTEEVAALAARVRPAVAPGGLWVVSDFAVPEGWFGRWAARPVVMGLYWSFGLLTGLKVRRLPDHAEGLLKAGFTLLERRRRLWGLLISELWTKAA